MAVSESRVANDHRGETAGVTATRTGDVDRSRSGPSLNYVAETLLTARLLSFLAEFRPPQSD
jgi:hypothetical protein